MTNVSKRNRRRVLIPWCVLLASLVLSGAAAALVANITRARDAARFERAVGGTTDRITARLSNYVTVLRAGAAFVSASEEVTYEEFERFVARFRLPELYPGTQGIGYTVRVRDEIRDSLVAAQRSGPFPDFRIWPVLPPGEEEHTIVYLFPLDHRNRAAIGYNMASEPIRHEAMARARDTGLSAMSGSVTLVQEIEGPTQAGFLIYTPVYREGVTPATVEERRAELHAFVYAPFRAGDLFDGIFGSETQPQVAFRVYDGLGTDPQRLLHDEATHDIPLADSPRFVTTGTIRIAGRPWTVVFTSTRAFEADSSGGGVWILTLVLGVAASLVLFLVTGRQAAAREDAEALALRLQESTTALERQVGEIQVLNQEVENANAELEASNRSLRESIHQLTELRAEADVARHEADRANRAKSEFLAAMSHELRTPLNAIMGYAELIDLGIHGPVTPDQHHALERIRRSQTHLLALINDILNYAKLEAGKVEARRDVVPLAAVFADLETMTAPQVRERGLHASFQPCPAGLAVRGDADKIQQILLNLLTNAVKFTGAGGEIRVRCDADAEHARIHIADTGQGIAADRLESIFDPFIQIDRAGDRGGHYGVGLGLAICRDLATLMHGEISVESEPGRGSVFTLRLPRAPAPPDHPEDAPRRDDR